MTATKEDDTVKRLGLITVVSLVLIVVAPAGAPVTGAGVRLQKVVHIPTDDVNTAYKRFQAGDSDWIPTVPVAQLESARQRPEFCVTPYRGPIS
jgi:hypothetical protein